MQTVSAHLRMQAYITESTHPEGIPPSVINLPGIRKELTMEP